MPFGSSAARLIPLIYCFLLSILSIVLFQLFLYDSNHCLKYSLLVLKIILSLSLFLSLTVALLLFLLIHVFFNFPLLVVHNQSLRLEGTTR